MTGRMTGKTRRILSCLASASAPVAAADIARDLRGLCDLATVYRTLHRLEKTGQVESFAFECRARGIERYYQPVRSPHRHFLHCETCHRFVDMGACRLGRLTRQLEEMGARIDAHTLYFTGRCASCGGGKKA